MEPPSPSLRSTTAHGARSRRPRRFALAGAAAFVLVSATLLSGCAVGGITAIAAGLNSACAISNGQVLCWGAVAYGDGSPIADAQVAGPAASGLTDAVQLAVGEANTYGFPNHVCARRATGAVVCWGDNTAGQLGDGTTTDRLVPTPVPGITDAVQISAAGYLTCARHATGSVSCWGQNNTGQLGNGTFDPSSTPGAVTGVADAVDIDVSEYTVCAVRATGTVACWGADNNGRLGNNDGVFANLQPTPSTVWGLTGATKVELRDSSVCAIAGGQVACWGRYIVPDHPSAMMTLDDPPYVIPGSSGAVDLTAVEDQACLLTASGSVRCWSYGGGGGDGTNNAYSSATDIGLANVTALGEADVNPLCVLLTNAEARCWGYNHSRALGVDTFPVGDKVLTPVSPIIGAG